MGNLLFIPGRTVTWGYTPQLETGTNRQMGLCETEYGIRFDVDYAEALRGELLDMQDRELTCHFGNGKTPSITLVAFTDISNGEVRDFGFDWGFGTGHELVFAMNRDQIEAMSGSAFFALLDQHLYECISMSLNIADEDDW